MRRGLILSALVTGALLLGKTTNAATLTLNAVDSGFYNDAGTFASSNGNYAAGLYITSSPPGQLRDFFVFDLSSVSGTITSAKLQILMPNTAGYLSTDPTETFTLFDATT